MSMGVYNLVGLSFHGIFYTGIISQFHQHWLSKGSLGLSIPRIGGVITIWDEVFCKLRFFFNGLVSRKNVFLESSHRIETNIDVFVEVLEVHISVSFDFSFEEEFIKLSWIIFMFDIPHTNIFCRMSTFQWLSLLVRQYHSIVILSLWRILLVWWGSRIFILIHHWCGQ